MTQKILTLITLALLSTSTHASAEPAGEQTLMVDYVCVDAKSTYLKQFPVTGNFGDGSYATVTRFAGDKNFRDKDTGERVHCEVSRFGGLY